MKPIEHKESQQQAVCGQAQMVLDNLARSRSLPGHLSLTIEEILERAWEIAYRRQSGMCASNVIAVHHWGSRAGRHERLENFDRSGHRVDI